MIAEIDVSERKRDADANRTGTARATRTGETSAIRSERTSTIRMRETGARMSGTGGMCERCGSDLESIETAVGRAGLRQISARDGDARRNT